MVFDSPAPSVIVDVVPVLEASESAASFEPALAVVKAVPDGAVNRTEYVPATSPSNRYLPSESVVVVRITVPEELSNSTVTPLTPGSPVSCTPSPSRSSKTKSPMLALPTVMVTVSVLFDSLTSTARPDTTAVLMSSPPVAVIVAVVVMVGALAPFARPAVRVQLITWPLIEQSHPSPVALTGVRPAGRVSVRVIGPGSAPGPALLTAIG